MIKVPSLNGSVNITNNIPTFIVVNGKVLEYNIFLLKTGERIILSEYPSSEDDIITVEKYFDDVYGYPIYYILSA